MISLQTLLHDHRTTLLQQERQAASLDKTGTVSENHETEIVNAMVEGIEWDCQCGYEPGRSEADKRYHEENCK